jgi:hypothetical protein
VWNQGSKTHIIHECHNIFHATIIISKDVPHKEKLMPLSYCAGSNKGRGWPRETDHTAFFLGWFSTEFPTTSKTCSYVKYQFNGNKSDNHLVLLTTWLCHFLVWLLFSTSLGAVISSSYFFFLSVSVSVWHNAHSLRLATLCTEVSSQTGQRCVLCRSIQTPDLRFSQQWLYCSRLLPTLWIELLLPSSG